MAFYIYRHIRLDNNTIFYIGKGTTDDRKKTEYSYYSRANETRGRSKWWSNIVKKAGYRVDIVFESESEIDILNKEIEFIKLYGRLNNKTGCLVNLTDGGEGASGHICSEETKLKHSLRLKGIRPSDLCMQRYKEFRKTYVMSEETRRKVSIGNMGKKMSDEAKRKISEAHKGEKSHMWGKFGELHPNYGKPVPDHIKRRYEIEYSKPINVKGDGVDLYFECTKDCARYFKCTVQAIRYIIRNKKINVQGRLAGLSINEIEK